MIFGFCTRQEGARPCKEEEKHGNEKTLRNYRRRQEREEDSKHAQREERNEGGGRPSSFQLVGSNDGRRMLPGQRIVG